LPSKYDSILAMSKDFESEIKRRRRRKFLTIVFVCLIVLSLLFLRIWMSSDAVEIAYEIDELDAKKQALQKENEKILVEISKLKSTDRVSEIATNELNMVRSPETKVIFIDRQTQQR